MNVSPEAVLRLVDEGLADGPRNDPRLRELASTLAGDLVVYGERVLPRDLFAKPSGIEIAAMVCEDVEGALLAEPLLGERMIEVSRGRGLLALVLAVLHPQRHFGILAPDLGMQWYLRRLTLLLGVRNLDVHTESESAFAADRSGSLDLVVVKGMEPEEALDFAIPLLRENGRVLSFQRRDRSAEVRRPRTDPRGRPVRLETTHLLGSAPARGRTILCVGPRVPELDAGSPAA